MTAAKKNPDGLDSANIMGAPPTPRYHVLTDWRSYFPGGDPPVHYCIRNSIRLQGLKYHLVESFGEKELGKHKEPVAETCREQITIDGFKKADNVLPPAKNVSRVKADRSEFRTLSEQCIIGISRPVR